MDAGAASLRGAGASRQFGGHLGTEKLGRDMVAASAAVSSSGFSDSVGGWMNQDAGLDFLISRGTVLVLRRHGGGWFGGRHEPAAIRHSAPGQTGARLLDHFHHRAGRPPAERHNLVVGRGCAKGQWSEGHHRLLRSAHVTGGCCGHWAPTLHSDQSPATTAAGGAGQRQRDVHHQPLITHRGTPDGAVVDDVRQGASAGQIPR